VGGQGLMVVEMRYEIPAMSKNECFEHPVLSWAIACAREDQEG
jgi:hypothetical protein